VADACGAALSSARMGVAGVGVTAAHARYLVAEPLFGEDLAK
jgi:hypothetical protein